MPKFVAVAVTTFFMVTSAVSSFAKEQQPTAILFTVACFDTPQIDKEPEGPAVEVIGYALCWVTATRLDIVSCTAIAQAHKYSGGSLNGTTVFQDCLSLGDPRLFVRREPLIKLTPRQ